MITKHKLVFYPYCLQIQKVWFRSKAGGFAAMMAPLTIGYSKRNKKFIFLIKNPFRVPGSK